jgi:hypothetical protein
MHGSCPCCMSMSCLHLSCITGQYVLYLLCRRSLCCAVLCCAVLRIAGMEHVGWTATPDSVLCSQSLFQGESTLVLAQQVIRLAALAPCAPSPPLLLLEQRGAFQIKHLLAQRIHSCRAGRLVRFRLPLASRQSVLCITPTCLAPSSTLTWLTELAHGHGHRHRQDQHPRLAQLLLARTFACNRTRARNSTHWHPGIDSTHCPIRRSFL